MSLLGRLTQRVSLRRSADLALATGLDFVSDPLDALPPQRSSLRRRRLDAAHLADMWPDELRGPTPTDVPAAERLRRDFTWIADAAGRKLDELDHGSLDDADRRNQLAEIVEEARTFADIAVRAVLSGMKGMPAPGKARGPTTRPGPALADTVPMKIINRATTVDSNSQLARQLTFVVRQAPRVAWVAGMREDGSTVMATDVAHGWIPPRLVLPAGAVCLAPAFRSKARWEAVIAALRPHVSYVPGEPFPAADPVGVMSCASTPQTVAHPDSGKVVHRIAHHVTMRDGFPPAIRSAVAAAAAGRPTVPAALSVVFAHVDTTCHQILSDYPLVDNAVLGDCMLLAAIEGVITGNDVSAMYHAAWYEALFADHE